MGTKSFEEIYKENFRAVYNYVYMQLLHREETEDIVSDVFVKAYAAYGSYSPSVASEKTWLFRIAKNLLIDYYRHKAASPVELAEDEVLEAVPSDKDEFASIEDDTNRTVYLVLEQLRIEEREILVMRYIRGMKNPQIAKELGIADKAVSERIRRALAKCRKIMEKLGLENY